MNDQESTTLSRNTKVTLGSAISAAIFCMTVGLWVISEIGKATSEFRDAVAEMTSKLEETNRRVLKLEEYNEFIYKDRWTAQHTEVWWLRSERENPGGTGMVDPRTVKNVKE